MLLQPEVYCYTWSIFYFMHRATAIVSAAKTQVTYNKTVPEHIWCRHRWETELSGDVLVIWLCRLYTLQVCLLCKECKLDVCLMHCLLVLYSSFLVLFLSTIAHTDLVFFSLTSFSCWGKYNKERVPFLLLSSPFCCGQVWNQFAKTCYWSM